MLSCIYRIQNYFAILGDIPFKDFISGLVGCQFVLISSQRALFGAYRRMGSL